MPPLSFTYEIRSQTRGDVANETHVFRAVVATVIATDADDAIERFVEAQEMYLSDEGAIMEPPLDGEAYTLVARRINHDVPEEKAFRLLPTVVTEFQVEGAQDVVINRDETSAENPANANLPDAVRRALRGGD